MIFNRLDSRGADNLPLIATEDNLLPYDHLLPLNTYYDHLLTTSFNITLRGLVRIGAESLCSFFPLAYHDYLLMFSANVSVGLQALKTGAVKMSTEKDRLRN